jgi:hypothetical protein
MVLVVVTVVCIAALIAVLAIFLFIIGVLLTRIADNLDDCLGNVKTIAQQAETVIPGVEHINRTGGVVAGALPLLYGGAEKIAAKLAAPTPAPVNGHTNVPASGRRRSRLMDTVGFRGRSH